ncbi:hypothetical protein MKJ01_12195 [Chryseobacterium sp. SSA4.19]|uniref:hypothetical protein n=1 Tax=Chryseobacterium sp. SSA4.19 TaxID=2919915 RepID=UPI001F4DEC5C|nr:hypothetical protein [Chryseobacterium sp. SSA4.19]MCJ8154525.1 hypothetical protein [Chryseobacterium sp. SSA4.19]
MFIIFNFGALIQAVTVGLFGFFFYKLGFWNFISGLNLSMHNKNIIISYGVFLLLVITYKLGARGKIFFIPTWILILIFIFIENFGNGNEQIDNGFNTTFTYSNYILPIILFLITFLFVTKKREKSPEAKENQENNLIQQ